MRVYVLSPSIMERVRHTNRPGGGRKKPRRRTVHGCSRALDRPAVFMGGGAGWCGEEEKVEGRGGGGAVGC